MAYKYKERTLKVGKAWQDDDGFKHPYNWSSSWSADDLKKWGVSIEADVDTSYDDKFYWAKGIERKLADENVVDEIRYELKKDLLSEDYWQSFDPSTVQGYRYNEFYVGFYGGTAGFVFDLRRGDFFELDFYADAGYFDSANGTLYLMVDNELVKFDEGSVLNYEWVSKQFDINAITFSCMKVFAPNLSATNVILHVDGEQLASIPLVGADPFVRLPAFRGSRLHIELSGSDEIESIALATSPGELNG